MQAERRLEAGLREIKLACDRKRPPQLIDGRLRRKFRALVEPFRDQQLGAGACRPALAFNLDLDAHKCLRRRVDDDGAEAERSGKRHGPFEEGNIAYGKVRRHGS